MSAQMGPVGSGVFVWASIRRFSSCSCVRRVVRLASTFFLKSGAIAAYVCSGVGTVTFIRTYPMPISPLLKIAILIHGKPMLKLTVERSAYHYCSNIVGACKARLNTSLTYWESDSSQTRLRLVAITRVKDLQRSVTMWHFCSSIV